MVLLFGSRIHNTWKAETHHNWAMAQAGVTPQSYNYRLGYCQVGTGWKFRQSIPYLSKYLSWCTHASHAEPSHHRLSLDEPLTPHHHQPQPGQQQQPQQTNHNLAVARAGSRHNTSVTSQAQVWFFLSIFYSRGHRHQKRIYRVIFLLRPFQVHQQTLENPVGAIAVIDICRCYRDYVVY